MDIMSVLGSKAVIFAIGMFSGVIIKQVHSFICGKLLDMGAAKLDSYIDKAFEAGDDIDDELMLAFCIWAEKKWSVAFPDGGKGEEKYAAVASRVIALIAPKLPIYLQPLLKVDNAKLKEIIEKYVARMKEILKNKISERKA